MQPFHGAAIIGAAELPYARRRPGGTTPGNTTMGLLAAVYRQAIAHAGIAHKDVDGIGVSAFTLAPDHAIDVAWQLGLSPRWCMQDTLGGASGINLVQHAARAVQAGDAQVIVLLAADHFEPGDFKHLVDTYNRTTRDHLAPLGFGGPNALFAMLTQRHAAAHGLARTDYGAVCIAQREWASQNPNAVYRTPLTMQDYLDAPEVAPPLGRFDCVPVVSGANALVLAAPTRGSRPVAITALAAAYNLDHQEGPGWPTGLAQVAPNLWASVAQGPADMDLVSVYDDYPVMVLAQLADLGFVPDNDLKSFIQTKIRTRILPINTSGGQLSAGQAGAAGGMHGLVEAVIQLRNEAGPRQVPNARRAVVAGYGMVQYRYGMCANALILDREITP